jgi:UDP-2-acetamido-2,6-beta-L-arabino-hexul-4-ose reductase
MGSIRIGITGAAGFLGWHLRVHLLPSSDTRVICADRGIFADPAKLRDFAAECDAIVHLAGVNRGADYDVETGNLALAEALRDACMAADCQPHVIFANSTHSSGNTAYGRSKRRCAELFSEWAARAGAPFTNVVLPHVFGEGGRPYYNSVVATFCHQLANGRAPQIDQDGVLELIHAQRVAAEVLSIIRSGTTDESRPAGTSLRVSGLLQLLETIAHDYRNDIIPCINERLDFELFNTYRSFRFPTNYPVALALHRDVRGTLFEAVKSRHGGQGYLSTTRPGVTRGNHYHSHKFERFVVIQGEALIRVRKLLDRTVHEFRVSGAAPQYIDMPTFHTHDITNIGTTELVTLFWADELFDPDHPDTYAEKV